MVSDIVVISAVTFRLSDHLSMQASALLMIEDMQC